MVGFNVSQICVFASRCGLIWLQFLSDTFQIKQIVWTKPMKDGVHIKIGPQIQIRNNSIMLPRS